ncbi:hypothetical protein FOVSG1_003643 [Fusarium oxysporum f. sp. vasinfectum]
MLLQRLGNRSNKGSIDHSRSCILVPTWHPPSAQPFPLAAFALYCSYQLWMGAASAPRDSTALAVFGNGSQPTARCFQALRHGSSDP